jgi:hypothetical protein
MLSNVGDLLRARTLWREEWRRMKFPLIIFAKEQSLYLWHGLLEADKAQLWVGRGHAPLDNADALVAADREMMRERYPHVPSGMSVGNPAMKDVLAGKRFMKCEQRPLELVEIDGISYFEVRLSAWSPGAYRCNIHSLPGVQSPVGTPLNPALRDHDVSWPLWWEQWAKEQQDAAYPWMRKELNVADADREREFDCFGVLIYPGGRAFPFGDNVAPPSRS